VTVVIPLLTTIYRNASNSALHIYFSSLHVSGIHVTIIKRKLLYLYETGVCHSVWVASGVLVGFQLGAQFCLTYLFLFSTCFGHPCAHHQEKITVSMRNWCLSLCMGGVCSADQTPPIQCDKYQCRIDTVIFS
jgi:uncharacterized membrane protein